MMTKKQNSNPTSKITDLKPFMKNLTMPLTPQINILKKKHIVNGSKNNKLVEKKPKTIILNEK
jgi:hypothetical protein